jgi:hypothetical protein
LAAWGKRFICNPLGISCGHTIRNTVDMSGGISMESHLDENSWPQTCSDHYAASYRSFETLQECFNDLHLIQRVILEEEGQAMSIEEVLVRVLGFYRRFVPYK